MTWGGEAIKPRDDVVFLFFWGPRTGDKKSRDDAAGVIKSRDDGGWFPRTCDEKSRNEVVFFYCY